MHIPRKVPAPLELLMPLERQDIKSLLDDENTGFYSLWQEYQNSSLSIQAGMHLAEFESSLRKMFGEEQYLEVAEQMRKSIPHLVCGIREGNDHNAEDKISFLVGLYVRTNQTLRDSW
jgi:hypothetical protein